MNIWELSGEDSYYSYVQDQRISSELIESLIFQGKTSPTGRARLCLHNHPASPLHIMLIYHDERTIVPIHRHTPSGEFLLIKDGDFDLIFYDDDLSITTRTCIGSSAKKDIFCHTPANVWHTLKFSGPTIFFEISQGPFDEKVTEFATFT